MRPQLVDILLCPACDCGSPDLSLDAQETRLVQYRTGPVEEVVTGSLTCAGCGRSYAIEKYVLSFEELYPPDLRAEGDYWGKYYGFMKERAYLGFFDLREPVAPLVAEGVDVLDPGTLGGKERGGAHSIVLEHPAFSAVRRLLDVGCGTGWSSLYFARRGLDVVAFDPSAANMRLAKEYAISQGEHVEYIGAALGFLDFKSGVFDGATAFYSLHHVPNLRAEMARLREWIREGGVMATDEHIRTDLFLVSVMNAMHDDIRSRLNAELLHLPPEVLARFPSHDISAMEGAGSDNVVEAFVENFAPTTFTSRYIGLDRFSFFYYLTKGLDRPSYRYAGEVVQSLSHYINEAFPELAEVALLVGYKLPPEQVPGSAELAARALEVAGVGSSFNTRCEYEAALEGLRSTVDGLQSAVSEMRSIIDNMHSTLVEKNRHILEVEEWASSMERALQARDAAAPAAPPPLLDRVRGRLRRILGRSR